MCGRHRALDSIPHTIHFRSTVCPMVIHAAARTGVPAAWQDPAGFIADNTLGTVHVLEQCRAHGCGMTFLSAYIYGWPRSVPIREDHAIDANNTYALSKHLAEQTCLFYASASAWPSLFCDSSICTAPGQDERFLNPLHRRSSNRPACEVVEVMDLAPSRDYVFIEDTVDAILRAMQAPAGSIFNVGSGEAHSVEDVIRRICSAAGVEKPYRAERSAARTRST